MTIILHHHHHQQQQQSLISLGEGDSLHGLHNIIWYS